MYIHVCNLGLWLFTAKGIVALIMYMYIEHVHVHVDG